MLNIWDRNITFGLGKKYDEYLGLENKVGYQGKRTINYTWM